jgi:HEAT repeat protein
MRGVDILLLAAGVMLAAGLLTVLAWFLYSFYLDRVERRLTERKGLYRELVAELGSRDRTLLEPTIHQMRTLYDLDALEAVLEEQARTASGRPGWLLEVYDQLGLVDKYIDKLRTARKWRDRAFAAELLGRVGSAKAVPALLETVRATQTEDADVREIALRALARIADPAAVEPLVAALARAEVWLAPRIADILARHGEAVVDPLLRLLTGPGNNPARAWAANVLGEVKASPALPALIRSLDDSDDEVRAKSAAALGRLGDRRAISPLLDRLLSDPAPFVRVRIASTLGQFGGPEVVDRLVRALGDSAWWVRMRGVEALEQIGLIAEGPLVLALNDSDPEIRQRAAVSLERLGLSATLLRRIEDGHRVEEALSTLAQLAAAGTRELIAELLLHPSLPVRTTVISAIREARRPDLSAELGQVATRDPDPAARRAAFEALRCTRTRPALTAGLTGVADPDPEVRIAALKLLGEAGHRGDIEVVRTQAENAEPRVRAAAVRTLGSIGARGVQADLSRAMTDREALVREAAVRAAAEAGLRDLVPDVVGLLSDPDERVRLATAHALGVLGDTSATQALLQAFERASRGLRSIITLAISQLDPDALGQLIDRLNEADDIESRLVLAHTLDRLRWTGGLRHLGRLARDPAPEVRAVVLRAMGRSLRPSGPPPDALVDAVATGLRDPVETVRAAAIDLCSRRCLEDFGPDIVALLQSDPSPVVRERAALATGLLRTPAGEATLVAASRHADSPDLRAAAVLAAGAYDRSSLVTLMLEMPDETAVRERLRHRIRTDAWFRLLSRSLPRMSGTEIRALIAPTSADAQRSLATGIRSVLDAGERARLITGLSSFQGEQSRDALLQLIRVDPNPEVRTAALTSVAHLLDPDELLAFGTRALGDPSIMVRRAAVGLFAPVPPDRAWPRLIGSLRVDDDATVLAAAGSLAEQQFESFRDAILRTPLENERAILVARLSRYVHHPDLAALLFRLARSPAAEVRDAVAEVWRHRPDAADPLALEAIIGDPVVAVRLTAVGAAAATQRYDLLDRMTQDPDLEVRREIATTLSRAADVGPAGLVVLEHLDSDPEMAVRTAAYAARLIQGEPVPLPPDLDPRMAADAVRNGADLGALRNAARTAGSEDRRLSAALALALLQDQVAREVSRTDPAPSVRHRVAGALDLLLGVPGAPA